MMKPALLLALPVLAAALPARAEPAAVARGHRLAQANCARCHAIGAAGESPDAMAPPFRNLAERNPGRSMDEIFADALLVGHTDMPRFGMREPERADILAYLASIKQTSAAPSR